MYIEYFFNSIEDNENEIRLTMDKLNHYPIHNILTLYSNLKFFKKNFPKYNYGCFIDYPISTYEFSKRHELIIDAIDIGARFICITVPFSSIINRKYSKFKEDIEKNKDICLSKNIELRYILEYRKFDHNILSKICNILVSNNINIAYPSTGFFIDNADDNIIASTFLKTKTNINMIINANIWTDKQVQNIINSEPYGISVNQILALEMVLKYLHEKDK